MSLNFDLINKPICCKTDVLQALNSSFRTVSGIHFNFTSGKTRAMHRNFTAQRSQGCAVVFREL